jgi:hypothetical protein
MTKDTVTDSSTEGHTERKLTFQTVTHISQDGKAITGSDGWTMIAPDEVAALLKVGSYFGLETKGFNEISGWHIDGVWYARRSDNAIREDFELFLDNSKKRRLDALESNRPNWQAREAKLPTWIRERLEYFREQDKEEFEVEGWGYELVISELAVMYAKIGEQILDKTLTDIRPLETTEITELADEQGTTGNQHAMALGLAKQHLLDPERSMSGTIGALAPLTGQTAYTKE